MKKLLKEDFQLKRGTWKQPKTDKVYDIVYLDPAMLRRGDFTFIGAPEREILKKYGASFIKSYNYGDCWCWKLGLIGDKDYDGNIFASQKIETIKQCVKELIARQKNNDRRQTGDSVVKEFFDAIGDAEKAMKAIGDTQQSREILDKLSSFKMDLMNEIGKPEFKDKFKQVMEFRRGVGRKFSFSNTLLIYVQRPDAKNVKSATKWGWVNRIVKNGAKPIYLSVPKTGENYKNEEQKKRIIQAYLNDRGVSTPEELPLVDRENLEIETKGFDMVKSFTFASHFYDVSDTEQIKDAEVLVDDNGSTGEQPDIPWSAKGPATDDTIRLVEAIKKVIIDSGISLEYRENLGGALGVSMSGRIAVLKDAEPNIGFFSTLVHEFSHELLHQKYLESKTPSLKVFRQNIGDRHVIEQQAETSAWCVMKFYGYNVIEALNYTTMWGMTEKNAMFIFDNIIYVSDYIIDKMENSMKTEKVEINESAGTGQRFKNGYELANAMGFGDMYLKSWELNNPERAQVAENIAEKIAKNFID